MVNINAVEQFLGDLDLPEEQPAVRHTAKIAVVGSGPAGLSCACFMARMGYPVTVFEAAPRPGGMLRYGIPAYRLPDAVVETHVARLEALGVSFRCNTRIGKGGDLTLGDLRRRGYKAFLLAPGTSLSRRIAIEGAELPGVLWGVEFLRAVRGDHAPTFSGHVVVVGGGDVAVDAAISAKRLGASSVSMVSRESEANCQPIRTISPTPATRASISSAAGASARRRHGRRFRPHRQSLPFRQGRFRRVPPVF